MKTIPDENERKQRVKWWRDGKYGMFIHWGLYAIPAGEWKESKHERGYSEWLMHGEKIPADEYAELAKEFNPISFNAREWVDVAKKAGMAYIVYTMKHHDGFSMYDSDVTDYTVVKATPWRRDPAQELADACREAGLKFCCYYSTDRDWYRKTGPGNRYDQTNTWDYPDSTPADFDHYIDTVVIPQVTEILTKYDPGLIWFDEIDMKSDEQIQRIYTLIRDLKPDCIINSRLKGCTFPKQIPPPCCDYISSGDNEIFDTDIAFEWENPASMNTSFGYNKFDNNWVAPKELITRMMNIISRRGNYLLNIGPTADGIVPQPSVDNLLRAGQWFELNGDAVYGSSPWVIPQETNEGMTDIRFTQNNGSIYAICLEWPQGEFVIRSVADVSVSDVSTVGSEVPVEWRQSSDGLHISNVEAPDDLALVLKIELTDG